MKKLACVAAVAMCIAGPTMAQQPYSWSGFYVGGNAGAGTVTDQGWTTNDATPVDRTGWGGLVGGQVGYNAQYNMLVFGVEAEGFWSSMQDHADFFDGNTLEGRGTVKNNSDFDIAGRFGLAFDRALVYGKAGVV